MGQRVNYRFSLFSPDLLRKRALGQKRRFLAIFAQKQAKRLAKRPGDSIVRPHENSTIMAHGRRGRPRACPGQALGQGGKQPNIIFFLSDDHRWDRLAVPVIHF